MLAAWLPGIQAGPALVRTLYGESNPTGKLVVSWPRSVGQEPLYYNALNTGRPADKKDLTNPPGDSDDTYVSRYLDERNDPQFPFGYRLSYTTFRYGSTEISGASFKASELTASLDDSAARTNAVLTATVDVTNTGSRPGEEIVQLYVRLIGTSVAQPVRALKGFSASRWPLVKRKKSRLPWRPKPSRCGMIAISGSSSRRRPPCGSVLIRRAARPPLSRFCPSQSQQIGATHVPIREAALHRIRLLVRRIGRMGRQDAERDPRDRRRRALARGIYGRRSDAPHRRRRQLDCGR